MPKKLKISHFSSTGPVQWGISLLSEWLVCFTFLDFNRFELPRGRRCGPEGPTCSKKKLLIEKEFLDCCPKIALDFFGSSFFQNKRIEILRISLWNSDNRNLNSMKKCFLKFLLPSKNAALLQQKFFPLLC